MPFPLYAKHRIKGAIIDSLRQLDWASRDQRRRQKQFESAQQELAAKLKRNPTQAEVADNLVMEIDRYQELLGQLQASAPHSASTRADEELPAPEFATTPEHQPDSICSKAEMKTALRQAANSLPQRYQRVVFLYYSRDLTMKEIGDLLGVNEVGFRKYISWPWSAWSTCLSPMASTQRAFSDQNYSRECWEQSFVPIVVYGYHLSLYLESAHLERYARPRPD